MSTTFDSLKFVRFSEITTKPSDSTVLFSVVVSDITPKRMRKLNAIRAELEKAFYKPTAVGVWAESRLAAAPVFLRGTDEQAASQVRNQPTHSPDELGRVLSELAGEAPPTRREPRNVEHGWIDMSNIEPGVNVRISDASTYGVPMDHD